LAQPLLLIAAIASIGLSPLLGQRDTLRADVDLVVVPASVKNADGRSVWAKAGRLLYLRGRTPTTDPTNILDVLSI